MNIIIPATADSIKPKINSFKNLYKIIKLRTAPIGSAMPDKNEYNKAFFLFLLAYKIGIETAMPSGILCMAIAKAINTPSLTFDTDEKKTAMPSGKLCMVMPNVKRIAVLFNFPFLLS